MRNEIEDGMGCAGLVATAQEKHEERFFPRPITYVDVIKASNDAYDLGRRHRKEEMQPLIDDWENWARGVCRDFKIDFDDHPAGLRLAIGQYLIDRGGPR